MSIDLWIQGPDKDAVCAFLANRNQLHPAMLDKNGGFRFNRPYMDAVEQPLYVTGRELHALDIASYSETGITLRLPNSNAQIGDTICFRDIPYPAGGINNIIGTRLFVDWNDFSFFVDHEKQLLPHVYTRQRSLSGYAIHLHMQDGAQYGDLVSGMANASTEHKSAMIAYARDNGNSFTLEGLRYYKLGNVRLIPGAELMSWQKARGIKGHQFSNLDID